MDQKTQRRIIVPLPELAGITEIDMLKLLSEAEIDLSSVKFVETLEEDLGITSDDALVVPLIDQQVADPKIETVVLAATQAGSSYIVGVWAPGQTETGIHPSVLKFGTAQIPWAPEKLKNELGSDCANAFQNPDGEDAEPNEIEPNVCE